MAVQTSRITSLSVRTPHTEAEQLEHDPSDLIRIFLPDAATI
ncbi:hypothetical protein [Roseomonas xinghualingensis]|nr:hypothetical protein [Roseomonas sp. SXEYE001]MCV4209329.1 hypothetical protein [Roseomonas sp. SXEYE001]